MRLALAIAGVIVIRVPVQLAMPQQVVSDGAAYFAMAQSLSTGGPMRDVFGQVAFYSPGYPLLLAPLFGLFGATPAVALCANLVLAAATAWLLHRLTLRLLQNATAALLAVVGYAVWLPSLLATATLAKENLTTPLMLGFLLALLAMMEGQKAVSAAVVAGLCYGAGLLAGASSLMIVAAFAMALVLRRHPASARPALTFMVATLLVTGPWLLHTTRHFGQPVLTTNGGFNLYLGNNPAATGAFVSIADTPAGPRWETMRRTLGENGSAAALGDEAKSWAIAHPARATELAATKLALFWAPNIPDAAEAASLKDAVVRWSDVVQHLLILGLGFVGLWSLRRRSEAAVVATVIASFWAVHLLTYVMVRYREPVMPIMIALAAIGLCELAKRGRLKT
jgi:hypothetical protein